MGTGSRGCHQLGLFFLAWINLGFERNTCGRRIKYAGDRTILETLLFVQQGIKDTNILLLSPLYPTDFSHWCFYVGKPLLNKVLDACRWARNNICYYPSSYGFSDILPRILSFTNEYNKEYAVIPQPNYQDYKEKELKYLL